jgi:hypothetical protein
VIGSVSAYACEGEHPQKGVQGSGFSYEKNLKGSYHLRTRRQSSKSHITGDLLETEANYFAANLRLVLAL